jgi:hypothetical protein
MTYISNKKTNTHFEIEYVNNDTRGYWRPMQFPDWFVPKTREEAENWVKATVFGGSTFPAPTSVRVVEVTVIRDPGECI